MDRSFLADEPLARASRGFVCIRIATYENAEEAKFLKTILTSRSGELENTVFGILDPDGRPVSRSMSTIYVGSGGQFV